MSRAPSCQKASDAEKERFDEEWRADIDETPGDLGKLLIAVGFQFAAWRMHSEVHSPVERLRDIAVKIKRTLYEAVQGWRSSWVIAFGVFALVVAAPFMVERLLGHHPQFHGSPSSHGFPWDDAIIFGSFGLVVLAIAAVLVWLTRLIFQADEISNYLTLAEREMNRLLRVGNVVEARATAFLLRELYEGNVATAQLKIHNEIENGSKPVIAPGLRSLLELDRHDEVKEGLSSKSGVAWFPLFMAVKLHRHPHNIFMVKPDKKVVENWDVIEELTREK